MLAVGLLALVPSAAAADFRDGTQVDPQNDASITFSDGTPGVPSRLLDIRSVRAEYDAGLGWLKIQFLGDALYGISHEGFNVAANFSARNGAGKCDHVLRRGDVRFEGSELARAVGFPDDPPRYGVTVLDGSGASLTGGIYETDDLTGVKGPSMQIQSTSLIGGALRCVWGVSATKSVSGFVGSSRDDVDDFGLGPSDAPGPTAAPALSATGSTLTWSQAGNLPTYEVAISAAPEGSPGRNTTYVEVTGTTFNPPPAPGATRWYSVRVKAPDSLWARPEVSISFPAVVTIVEPPPPPPAITPPTGATGTTNSGPTGTPAAVGAGLLPNPVSAASTPAPKQDLTLRTGVAKNVARRVLTTRYRKFFTKRANKSFKIACESLTDSKVRCDVRWQYSKYSYAGTITITRKATGDAWRTVIKRKAIKRS